MCAKESLPVRVRGEFAIPAPTAWTSPTLAHLELIREAMRRWAEDGEHA
ncbi:hypothetical protein [Nocardia flavorosea]|uniref:Uncharacterized protein n=1 Tax=Nocardia flavorosea TaxID=53429 RepID=A0A846YMR7_9NOCA|nr:hypothetical protein [Nocardia flavorosea]NKY58578.1 hypothetical protein [Nocardia flavorosea]